jgi:hypothetical protein
MTPDDRSELSVSSLLALRQEPDAVRAITDKLRVKDMGPADHIRTKHEVKVFVEAAGDMSAAEALLKRARERREVNQSVTSKLTQRHGQRMTE